MSDMKNDQVLHAESGLNINPIFRDLVPALTADERTRLEESIINEGCRDPIVIWTGTGCIIDGHNRYDICRRHAIDYPVIGKEFADEEEAKGWIIKNQLARRNLSADQRNYLLGMLYNTEKKHHGGDRSSGQNAHLKTAEILARNHDVNERTVRRAGKFAEVVEEIKAEAENDSDMKEIISKAKAKIKAGKEAPEPEDVGRHLEEAGEAPGETQQKSLQVLMDEQPLVLLPSQLRGYLDEEEEGDLRFVGKVAADAAISEIEEGGEMMVNAELRTELIEYLGEWILRHRRELVETTAQIDKAG